MPDPIDDATTKQRAWAVMFDLAIPVLVAVPGIAAWTLGPDEGSFAATMLLTVTLVVLAGWVVMTIALLATRGQTIGRVISGIRVVTPEGGNPSFWQSVLVYGGARLVRARRD